ncbi:hypothetical protein ACJQWK_05524 [Exserohilum turcicum]
MPPDEAGKKNPDSSNSLGSLRTARWTLQGHWTQLWESSRANPTPCVENPSPLQVFLLEYPTLPPQTWTLRRTDELSLPLLPSGIRRTDGLILEHDPGVPPTDNVRSRQTAYKEGLEHVVAAGVDRSPPLQRSQAWRMDECRGIVSCFFQLAR